MNFLFWLFIIGSSIATVRSKGCEPITIPLCRGIGYNMTSFPNSYGHEKQEEAGLEVHQFYPLVEVGCYQHLKFFLCTLYTPICQDNYDKPILPCMELCLEAKKRCSPIMQRYGFRWPETLYCDSLPRMADQLTSGNICAAPPDTPKQLKKQQQQQQILPVLPLDEQNPLVIDIGEISVPPGDCSCRCSHPYQTVSNRQAFVGNVSGCSYPCYSSTLTEKNKPFLTSWMGVWSITCFILSAFTFLTFLIETDRFQYPERPIFMLAFCQMMVAVGFIIRIFVGHEQIACDQYRIRGVEDGNSSVCLLVFLLTYFFGMAASVWWVVLSLTWVLAAASKWSSEAIASYSFYFHVLGWLVPAGQTVLVLIFHSIDGDPITGMCYVGNTDVMALRIFVLAPLIVYFSLGVFFLFVGFFNLWRIRNEVQKQHPGLDNASKLTQLMSKIGIFSVLYTVPALFVIMALFYEQHNRQLWEEQALCPCATKNGAPSRDMALILALVKTACMCVVGWTSGVWICSRKTLSSWLNLICCLGRPVSNTKYQAADLIYGKSEISIPPHFYNTALRQNHIYGAIPNKL
ncbi:unnamed protein product [Auanema sp. JU1783]|nr:unnamed protein product [Auanema sp. JU1783]